MNVREVGMANSDWLMAARSSEFPDDPVYVVNREVKPTRAWYYLCFPGSLPIFIGSNNNPPGNFPYGEPVIPDG